ncbi:MAG TPA: hypothetical protein VKA48_05755, partial [Gammaproteobacteria bacterium]|nr:hypothetical protein [Gammaproteobacteria bacterium]
DQVERVITLRGYRWRDIRGIAEYLGRFWPDEDWAGSVLVVWQPKGRRVSVQSLDPEHHGLTFSEVKHIQERARAL